MLPSAEKQGELVELCGLAWHICSLTLPLPKQGLSYLHMTDSNGVHAPNKIWQGLWAALL